MGIREGSTCHVVLEVRVINSPGNRPREMSQREAGAYLVVRDKTNVRINRVLIFTSGAEGSNSQVRLYDRFVSFYISSFVLYLLFSGSVAEMRNI